MVRFVLGVFLLGCLAFQVSRINDPPEYLKVGKRSPFDLVNGGTTISQLPDDCMTGFVVTATCPFCNRLAESFAALGDSETEPVWFVSGGAEATRTFSEEHSLPPRLVYSLAKRKRMWPFSAREPSIPFTPLRVILNRSLVIMDLSQSQSIPSAAEKEELCALKPQ